MIAYLHPLINVKTLFIADNHHNFVLSRIYLMAFIAVFQSQFHFDKWVEFIVVIRSLISMINQTVNFPQKTYHSLRKRVKCSLQTFMANTIIVS